MSIHDGHRQRLKDRFLKSDLDDFTDIQVLEMLLFYAIPRRDTNPIAHALLDRFGSLSQVLDAPVEELMKVPGVGESAATLIHMIPSMARAYMVDKRSNIKIVDTVQKCGEYLFPHFLGRRVETAFLLCLDAKCKVLCCKEVGRGDVNSAAISVRNVVETAIAANASIVALGHNHPTGVAVPTEDDFLTTRRIAKALNSVGIKLIEHIVASEDDYLSFAQSGWIRNEDSEI